MAADEAPTTCVGLASHQPAGTKCDYAQQRKRLRRQLKATQIDVDYALAVGGEFLASGKAQNGLFWRPSVRLVGQRRMALPYLLPVVARVGQDRSHRGQLPSLPGPGQPRTGTGCNGDG